MVEVQKGKNGEPKFIVDVMNPARCYPEWDNEQLVAVAYDYDISAAILKSRAATYEWDLPAFTLNQGSTKVTQLWEQDGEKVYQTVLSDGREIQKKRDMKRKRIPIIIGSTAGEGNWGGSYTGDTAWVEHMGEGILEPNFEMIKGFNRWLTHMMQITRDAANSAVIHSGGVAGQITPGDLKDNNVVDVQPNEDVQRLQPSQVPPAVGNVMGILSEKIQQGGFVWSLFGSSGAINLSGFAIQQLLTSAYATVGEYYETAKSVIAEVDERMLEEYKEGNFKSMKVPMYAKETPHLVVKDFTPDIIPEEPNVEVEFELAAPRDTFEKIAAARQAHPNGNIMDLTTVLDEIVGVNDPTMVKKRLDDEATEQDPTVIMIRNISSLRRFEMKLRNGVTPDNELADVVKQSWTGMLMQLGGKSQNQAGAPGTANPGIPPGVAGSPESQGQPRRNAGMMPVSTGTPANQMMGLLGGTQGGFGG
jgi:hypothetical protein